MALALHGTTRRPSRAAAAAAASQLTIQNLFNLNREILLRCVSFDAPPSFAASFDEKTLKCNGLKKSTNTGMISAFRSFLSCRNAANHANARTRTGRKAGNLDRQVLGGSVFEYGIAPDPSISPPLVLRDIASFITARNLISEVISCRAHCKVTNHLYRAFSGRALGS